MNEPVLLVGETGSGKTTSVQELANLTFRKLVVQNLSLSTDASDLLGGFRPVSMRQLFQPTYTQFVDLFQTTFSSSQNTEFLQVVSQLFKKQQWKRLLKAFLKATENATTKLNNAVTTTKGTKGGNNKDIAIAAASSTASTASTASTTATFTLTVPTAPITPTTPTAPSTTINHHQPPSTTINQLDHL